MSYWLLPEFIEDILPIEAFQLESLRRELLDLFDQHGYDLVIPPLIEYVESLLLDASPAADLRTFRLTDQMSGRMMGLRADITPQVARIDAHLLGQEGISRLCYTGPVAHTLPSSYLTNRQLIQIGAELFGSDNVAADVEIIRLAIESLRKVDIPQFQIDIGHMGLFSAIVEQMDIDDMAYSVLFDRFKVKDRPALEEITAQWPETERSALLSLIDLYGDRSVLDKARQQLPQWPVIIEALDRIETLVARLGDEIPVSIDLSQLRSYRYHTGIVFTFYSPHSSEVLGRGGRYDGIGEVFGRRRPAMGFTMDLRTLLRLSTRAKTAEKCVYAPPATGDSLLENTIERLRQQGYRVIEGFEDTVEDRILQGKCKDELRRIGDTWQVCRVADNT